MWWKLLCHSVLLPGLSVRYQCNSVRRGNGRTGANGGESSIHDVLFHMRDTYDGRGHFLCCASMGRVLVSGVDGVF